MNSRMNIPDELYENEVICFLAERYHTSSREIVRHFLVQTGDAAPSGNDLIKFRLEENEMEILCGLMNL